MTNQKYLRNAATLTNRLYKQSQTKIMHGCFLAIRNYKEKEKFDICLTKLNADIVP